MAYRIYLADDDRFLLDLYAVKFKNAGHAVGVFPGGEELLDALRKKENEPDAILLDLIMPGLDGFAVLEAIGKEKLAPKASIIILSNQGAEADLEKAKSLGAVGYIIKASAIPSEVLAQTVKTIENVS
jgi:two-component system alkaline phosphatase synthesis response regulator PhoP